MADFSAGFETGVSGNTIAITDAGNATVWDSVTGSPTYSSTHAAHGSLSMKALLNAHANWNLSATDHYGRFYGYIGGYPGSSASIVTVTSSANSVYIYILTDGKLYVTNDFGGESIQTTNSVSLNAWFRAEYHIFHASGTGTAELKLFLSPEDTSPTETITSPSTWHNGTSVTDIGFGAFGVSLDNWWMDDILANATSYPGPHPAPSSLPILIPSPVRW